MPPAATPSKTHSAQLDKLMKDMEVINEEESRGEDGFRTFVDSKFRPDQLYTPGMVLDDRESYLAAPP